MPMSNCFGFLKFTPNKKRRQIERNAVETKCGKTQTNTVSAQPMKPCCL